MKRQEIKVKVLSCCHKNNKKEEKMILRDEGHKGIIIIMWRPKSSLRKGISWLESFTLICEGAKIVNKKGYNIQSNSLIKHEVTAKSVASDEILIPMNTTFNFLCACRYMDQGHTIQKQYSDDSTQ